LQPDLVKARWCYAWSLLILGDFKRGWAWYECRSGLQEWSSRLRQWAELGFTLTKPKWNGEALAGRRILLLVEPGFGDTFQFVRYVPMVAERGGSVILACGSEQLRLFQCLNQYARVITHPPDCEFDVYCPVGSLPQIFKTDLGTIPVTTPYLWAEGELIAKWKARAPREGLRVGVIWSGNAPRTTGRGIALRQLTPLFRVPGVWFVSLQKNEAALQIREAPELAIADWGRELSDFAETAALMANLDLIISIDTATAHLAGALGRPVWTLLPFGADWRWLLNRADSPWYLTMRLFRQPKPGDWETPITQVAQALAAMTGRQGE
ncbi:MAG: glycosyltransferase family 9 protein, partial [Tepidisphaeraceae bacterium]